jgi:hypothetical protein
MLPRWHIFFGAIFTTIIWTISPETNLLHLSLVFLSSFLIDFDHYLVALSNTHKLSLNKALEYFECLGEKEKTEQKHNKRKKGHFYLFHTLEFHVLILLLSLIYVEFFYIFLGMIFHSLLDIAWMLKKNRIYRREFLLVNWINNKFK